MGNTRRNPDIYHLWKPKNTHTTHRDMKGNIYVNVNIIQYEDDTLDFN